MLLRAAISFGRIQCRDHWSSRIRRCAGVSVRTIYRHSGPSQHVLDGLILRLECNLMLSVESQASGFPRAPKALWRK